MLRSMTYEGSPVRLRPATRADAVPLFTLAQDPLVSEYLNWPPPAGVAETEAFLTRCEQEQDPVRHFCIILEENRAICGLTSFIQLDVKRREAEMGTWLGRAYWGQDLNRAVKALMFYYGFAVLELERLLLTVKAENRRSVRALECLPGLSLERAVPQGVHAKGRSWDQRVYAMSREAWAVAPYRYRFSMEGP